MSGSDPTVDPWADVIGQDEAVALLRSAAERTDVPHAWLFLGPRGSGKRVAARAFAGELLAAEHDAVGDTEAAARARTLAHTEQHPDLIVVERKGASIDVGQAADIVSRASRTATEGTRKVLVLDEFHLISEATGPKLLKTLEEPPDGTFFIVLADDIPPLLVTVASRCVQVPFAALSPEHVAHALVADGVAPERATAAADAAAGDLGRARLLATDDRLVLRLDAWREVPRRVDGTGATAAVLVDEIRAAIDDAEAPLKARHTEEVAALDERIERYGQRGSGASTLGDRHKRESRRLRTDEVQLGLATLARAYRDELAVTTHPGPAIEAIAAIQTAAESLVFNANEELLLMALLRRLPALT